MTDDLSTNPAGLHHRLYDASVFGAVTPPGNPNPALFRMLPGVKLSSIDGRVADARAPASRCVSDATPAAALRCVRDSERRPQY